MTGKRNINYIEFNAFHVIHGFEKGSRGIRYPLASENIKRVE